MTSTIYRYDFRAAVDFEDVEDSVMVALMATEALHGSTGIRLETRFELERLHRRCTVDASTRAGYDFNRIFAGLVIREFGDDAFEVARLPQRTAMSDAA